MRLHSIGLAVALLVAGAGIGLSETAGDSAVPFLVPDPCSLLSSAEITTAAGSPFQNGGSLFHHGTVAGCSFPRAAGGRIVVVLRRVLDTGWAAGQIERMRRGSYREIHAVGERSFLLMTRSGAALCVFQAPYYLQISAIGIGAGNAYPAVLQDLARPALGRIATLVAQTSPMNR